MLDRLMVQKVVNMDTAISNKMQTAINLWFDIFELNPPWMTKKTKPLNLAVFSTAYLARMVNAEFKFEVSGSPRADYINNQIRKYVIPIMVEKTQLAMVGGEIILKPVAEREEITVEWVKANRFYPLEYDAAGRATAAVFVDQRVIGNFTYTRLEQHRLENDGKYRITNTAYKSSGGELGGQIPLETVEAWAGLLPEGYIEGVEKPLFACLKMPLANNVDGESRLPISIYANAVKTLEELDRIYTDYCWEFRSGKRKLFVKELALPSSGNRISDDIKADLFVELTIPGYEEMFKDYTPNIREAEYQNGINQQLRIFEASAGVTAGTFSIELQTGAVTATEIMSRDRKTYFTVNAIQQACKTALEDLVYAMDVWADVYRLAPAGQIETVIEYGDSIFEDTNTRLMQRIQLVGIGLRPEYVIAEAYGIPVEKALEMLGESTLLTRTPEGY